MEALTGLDLVAESGQVAALLGPNGAGKTTFVRSAATFVRSVTTFVRSVTTLVRPDRGTLRVDGVDAVRHPDRMRRIIWLAGQHTAVEAAMTGRENLEMIARLFGLTRRAARESARRVLDRLSLGKVASRLARTHSSGLHRRRDLGASLVGASLVGASLVGAPLVGAPRLLLLDDPTTGLDPRSRIEMWDGDLVSASTDVLLTTQYLNEGT